MIPKSTVKLNEGDFCWIKREDGQFVPFIFLQKQDNSRSYFFGGLANRIMDQMNIDELGDNIKIEEFALLHIQCFKENNTPIVGNLLRNLCKENFETVRAKINSKGIGSTTKVWGYRTILKYANQLN